MMRALTTVILAAAVIALGAVNLELAFGSVDTAPIAAPPPIASFGTSGESAVRSDTRKSLAEYRATLERPLFVKERRPPRASEPTPVEKPAETADEPANPVNLRLTGILDAASGGRRALIVSPDEPFGKWLIEGAEIDGWRLVSIERRSVQITGGGKLKQLDMR